MSRRILDETTKSTFASDDYLYMDGATDGASKITPDNLVRNTTVAQQLADHITSAEEEVEQITTDIEGIQSDINDVKADIGDLSELETEDKSNLVNAINEAASSGGGGSGLTEDVKVALLQIAQKVAYIDDDGQDYYDDLYDALYTITAVTLNTNSLSFASLNSTQQLTATTTPAGGNVTWSSSNTSIVTVSSSGLVTSVGYGSATITATAGSVSATCSITVAQATLTSISAVYTQSGTVYDTDSLDSLKDDLVVTATWSNQTTSVVPSADYTLSGTLTEGTSTITVAYGGKTDTFNVTVTESTVDTTANVIREGVVLGHMSTEPYYKDYSQTNGGVTQIYTMDTPTTVLYPAGIIPTSGNVMKSAPAALYVLDSNNTPINFVSMATTSSFNRWAQDAAGTMTEFKQSWNISEYSKIQFSVDIRYLDDAYMYDYTTGQVWFAGINTPYYGMRNISEANS